MPLEYVLYCQSPALFWCALVLIVSFFARRGSHQIRAAVDLVLGLLCVLGGAALYYLGMYGDHFSIRDFWHIRVPGWIGLGLVVVLTLWQLIRMIRRSISTRQAARQAQREEKARQQELDEARERAYASGREDAQAAGRVAEHVAAAAEKKE